MAERELPPIRVRIVGDDAHFQKTLKSVLDAISQLNTSIKTRDAAQQKSQQSAELHQQKLQESAILHTQQLRNLQQKYRQSETEHLRKLHAAQQKSQEAATMHQQKLYDAQMRSQEAATMHQQRLYNAQQTNQRAADAAQQKSQEAATMHQQKLYDAQMRSQEAATMHQQRLYNAQQTNQRAADAAQQRSQQSAAMHQQRSQESATMHQQRLYNAQQTNQRAADAAQQRSQQSAAMHQQRLQQSATMHQQRLYDTQVRSQQSAAMHQQRSQESATMHQQRLYNAQQTNQRAADAAQQRSQQSAALHQQRSQESAAMHQQRLANSQQASQRAAAAAQQRSQQSAAMHQQRLANSQQANQRAAAAAQQRSQQSAAMHQQRMQQSAAIHQQRLANLITASSIAQAKAHVQVKNLMVQTTVIQQRLNNLQEDNRRKATKHADAMKKSAQHLADLQRKANQDAQMHALKMQALQQKMQIDREIHEKRMASRYYTTHKSAFTFNASSGRSTPMGGGSGGLGGGLTSRADIYMHTNAIRDTLNLTRNLVNLRIQYRENEVAIEAFAGSAERAAQAMRGIQQFAEVSPYSTIQLAESARNMMSFGVSTEETLSIMRHLGEVAGGSQFRLERLMFGMSQIASTGRLLGNDLKQLTEQGFNPLQTIAEKTGLSMDVLNKAKENGLITSKDVVDALKMETTGTGRFAGVLRRVSNEMGGLANQVRESIYNMGMEFVKVLEPSINQTLKKTLMFINALRDWMKTNPERVREMANLAKNVIVLKVGFHMLGLAVASVRWSSASLLSTLKGLRLVILPLTVSIAMLQVAAGSIAMIFGAIRAGSLVGAIGSILGIVKALAGLAAIGIGIAALRDYITSKGGLKEAFRAMAIDMSILHDRSRGFFANLKENLTSLDSWFRKNFDTILDVLSKVGDRMLSALLDNMALIGTEMINGFMLAFDWLIGNLPMLVRKIKDAWNNSTVGAGMGESMLRMGAAGGASILDTFLDPLVRNPANNIASMLGIKGRIKSFTEKVAMRESEIFNKTPSLQATGGISPHATGFQNIAKRLITGLKSGLSTKDLAGLPMPSLNFNIPKENIKEPALPDELAKFESDFKELLDRIMSGAEGETKDGKKSSVYSVVDAIGYNTSQFSASMYEYMDKLKNFQAGQKQQNQLQLQQAMSKTLEKIEQNTRNTKDKTLAPAKVAP